MLEHLDDSETFQPNADFRSSMDRRARQLQRRSRLARMGVGLALIAGLLGSAVGYVDRRDAAIDRIDVTTQPSTDGAVNILLVGSDRRDVVGEQAGAMGARADTIMVLRLEPDGSVRVLSIPRDLLEPVTRQRLNERYRGGIQGLVDTVQTMTGIPIDHTVEVDMAGAVEMVDLAGGLSLTAAAPLRDEFSGLNLQTTGCQRLDGQQVLALLRSHHVEYRDASGDWQPDPRGDLGRMAQGQAVIGIALDELADTATSPLGIDRLSRVLADHATLDGGLTLARLAEIGRRLAAAGRNRTTAETLPVSAKEENGAAFLVPAPAWDSVVQRYGAPSPTVQENNTTRTPLPATPTTPTTATTTGFPIGAVALVRPC